MLPNVVNIDSFWFLIKVTCVVLGGLYLLFSLIVVRQVYLMTEILQTSSKDLLRFFAWTHIFFVLGVIGILVLGLFR